MSTSRGVLYLKWGTAAKDDPILKRSIESLQRHHPELPYHVHEFPAGSSLLVKSNMFDVSPFDVTVYLDSDTAVLGRLDSAIDKAERFDLACCICENPWARRHRGLWDEGDLIEYQTGVLFFSRSAKPLFDKWRDLAPQIDSGTEFVNTQGPGYQAFDDQAAFAKAVAETGFNPFVLPLNWNFRPQWHKLFFGPIKIYHEYVPCPPELEQWNLQQSARGAVIHHAGLEQTRPT